MTQLNSLPAPDSLPVFCALHDSGKFENMLPVFDLRSGPPKRVIGLIIYTSSTSIACRHNPQTDSWEIVGKAKHEDSVYSETFNFLDKSVGIAGADIPRNRDLYYQLKQSIRDVVDGGWMVYEDEEPGNPANPVTADDVVPSDCDCSGETHSLSKDLYEFEMEVCKTCMGPTKVMYDGQEIPEETLYSADWLLSDAETDAQTGGSDWVLSPSGTSFSRADVAFATLSLTARREQLRLNLYKRDPYSAFGYLVDGELVGYLFWTGGPESKRETVVRQAYIRPEFRGNGYGSEMVSAWGKEIGVTDVFGDDPNEAGMKVFERSSVVDMTPYTVLNGVGVLTEEEAAKAGFEV